MIASSTTRNRNSRCNLHPFVPLQLLHNQPLRATRRRDRNRHHASRDGGPATCSCFHGRAFKQFTFWWETEWHRGRDRDPRDYCIRGEICEALENIVGWNTKSDFEAIIMAYFSHQPTAARGICRLIGTRNCVPSKSWPLVRTIGLLGYYGSQSACSRTRC